MSQRFVMNFNAYGKALASIGNLVDAQATQMPQDGKVERPATHAAPKRAKPAPRYRKLRAEPVKPGTKSSRARGKQAVNLAKAKPWIAFGLSRSAFYRAGLFAVSRHLLAKGIDLRNVSFR